jgi:hypothetical protein
MSGREMSVLTMVRGAVIGLCAWSLVAAGGSVAEESDSKKYNIKDSLSCVVRAAAAFGHDWQTLLAILDVEGGTVGAMSVNSDGSVDYGAWQINDSGFDELRNALGLSSVHDVKRIVRDDFCAGAVVASWWLRKKTCLMAGDRRRGVGAYNSATPGKLEAYLAKVDAASRRLFGRPIPGGIGCPGAERK